VLQVPGASANVTLTLENLTIQHGDAGPVGVRGGAVDAEGNGDTVAADGVSFLTNTAPDTTGGEGGAIFSQNVTLNNGVLGGNSAFDTGGAVEVTGTASVTGTIFTDNDSTNNVGGAIDYSGALTVTNATFGGASASQGNNSDAGGGAIATINGASLTVTDSTFQNDGQNGSAPGGAIFDGGNSPVTVTGSTFLTNAAGSGPGGAIDMEGPSGIATQTLTVTGSTFQGDQAAGSGGAIEVSLSSNQSSATVPITNSTFEGNTAATAGGAVSLDNPNGGSAAMTLRNDTLAQNSAPTGGGVNSDPGLTLIASIVSASTGPNCSGAIGDGGSNLTFAGGAGSSCPTGGTDVSGQDPLLGPLQANPPGQTETMALGAGSPAIDRVASGCPPPATDQRGVTRPQGPACDIGAFEVVATTATFAGVVAFTG